MDNKICFDLIFISLPCEKVLVYKLFTQAGDWIFLDDFYPLRNNLTNFKYFPNGNDGLTISRNTREGSVSQFEKNNLSASYNEGENEGKTKFSFSHFNLLLEKKMMRA